MKQFILSKVALNELIGQLEAKGDGFNIKQLHLLDKVCLNLTTPIADYKKFLDDRLAKAKADVKAITNPTPQQIQEINNALNADFDTIKKEQGSAQMTVQLEDEQFNFMKEIFQASAGLRGDKQAREIVIAIDDSLEAATEVKN